MRRLILQMQVSVDGCVAAPDGGLDWAVWNWDDELKNDVSKLTDSIDTILLGRKMTNGFIAYWSKVAADPLTPEYDFGKKMMDTPKYVFSRTLSRSTWKNTDLAGKDTPAFIDSLKMQEGKDIIVYGGAGFVSSLIPLRLIDEYHLFVNPAALGNGLRIFTERTNLVLKKSVKYQCGIVQNIYENK